MKKKEVSFSNDNVLKVFILVISLSLFGFLIINSLLNWNIIDLIINLSISIMFPLVKLMKVNLNKRNLKIILFFITSLTFLNILLHFITYKNTLNQFYLFAHISLIVALIFNISLNQKDDKSVNYFSAYFLLTLVLIGLSGYSYRNYYSPFKWVKDCSIGFHLTSNEDVSNEKVIDFCWCRYESFLNNYQEIKKIPNECNYTKQDIYDMYYCMINKLLDDSIKNHHLEKINIYVDEYFQELKEKCN